MVQSPLLKSHKRAKIIETHFLSFVFHNDGLQTQSLKSMTPKCVVVISVLLPFCCHIGSGMPYLCIFVKELVPLLGAMNDKWV